MSVSGTISDNFSVKEWRDLETGIRSRSRLLKIAPFDRSYTTFYWSAIVSIVLLPRGLSRHAVSVSVSVCHVRELCQNE